MFLFVLALCGFVAAMSGRILDPVVITIAAEFDMPVATVALLSTAYAVPFALFQPVLGPLGDIFSKALIVKWAVAILTICTAAAALAPSFSLLFVTRAMAGAAGAGVVPIGLALIGDRIPLSGRQLAISRFVAVVLLGQFIGSGAAGVLAVSLGWRGVLWLSALLTLAVAIAAIWQLRSATTAGPPSDGGQRSSALANYRAVLKNPLSYVCFGVVAVEGICIHGSLPFVSQYLNGLGQGGAREAGIVIAGMGIGGLSFSFVVPLLLRFLQRRQMMGLGGVIGGGGLALIALGTPWPVEAAFMAIIGFGFFLLHNSVQTEVSELAPTARASAFSLHAFSFYAGQALGPVLYGLGLHSIGLSASFAIAAAAFLLTGLTAYHRLR